MLQPSNNNTMLHFAKKIDIPIIQNLARKIWDEHYVPFIGQEQVDYMLAKFYSEESLLEQMNDGQDFYLIENEGLTGGFLAITKKENQDYFLNKFYIDSRGKGLGEKTFTTLLSFLPDAKTIRLTVNKHNFKSINFYFKMGFKIENTAVFDIGHGFVMDDFVMISNL
jgi:ribosomal protein S18 acetylase RimI-like enzyme